MAATLQADERHLYHPGFLFVAFGIEEPSAVVRPKRDYVPTDIRAGFEEIERVDP